MQHVVTGLAQVVSWTLDRFGIAREGLRVEAPETVLEKSFFLGRDEQIVWLYRPPWLMILDPISADAYSVETQKLTQEWIRVHRMLLRRRRNLGNQITLVNVSHSKATQFLRSLELTISAETDTERSRFRLVRAQEQMLEKSIYAAFPESFDLCEALNALAPNGLPPEDLYIDEVTENTAAIDLFALVEQGNKYVLGVNEIEDLRRQLIEAEAEKKRLMTLAKDFDEAGQVIEKEAHEKLRLLNDENLQMRFHVEELEKNNGETSSILRSEIEKLKNALKTSNTNMFAFRREMTNRLEDAQAELFRAVESKEQENFRLLERLHCTQEEVEAYFSKNQQLTVFAVSAGASAERGRVLLSELFNSSLLK